MGQDRSEWPHGTQAAKWPHGMHARRLWSSIHSKHNVSFDESVFFAECLTPGCASGLFGEWPLVADELDVDSVDEVISAVSLATPSGKEVVVVCCSRLAASETESNPFSQLYFPNRLPARSCSRSLFIATLGMAIFSFLPPIWSICFCKMMHAISRSQMSWKSSSDYKENINNRVRINNQTKKNTYASVEVDLPNTAWSLMI